MRVALLGTAAGGGFPQWNCNCRGCAWARSSPGRAAARSQCCIAVAGNSSGWFLVNASPDIRLQLQSFPPLWPPAKVARGSPIAGVLLTSADLDHTLGLLSLREGGPLAVHATTAVRQALDEGLNLSALMSSYHGIRWRQPPACLAPLLDDSGSESGIHYSAFPVLGKPPRYQTADMAAGDPVIGYRFVDASSGGSVVAMPGLGGFNRRAAAEAESCDLLLLDGTFFREDEMRLTGTGTATASEMGHLPVGGPRGSLAHIETLSHVNRVYVHINNTNPMLLEDSIERAAVVAAGVNIGCDGMEFSL
jgi:pyrroloquinoline quinone biosynthesis protein B